MVTKSRVTNQVNIIKNNMKKKEVAEKLKGAYAIGYGYKNPMRTNKAGELIGGRKYSYPINDENHLNIVKRAGGEYKINKK